MAVELAQAYVSIIPSARGIGRSIGRELNGPLTTAGRNAGDSAVSAFSGRFVSGMSHVAKRAAQAFTVGLGAAGLFGIRTAANFEQTRIAFEGILGDVEKANNLLGSLRDFANRTPFEFTDLSTAARQLLAVGTASDEIIPTMEILGNVAATLGAGKVEIEGTVRALGQMKGKGRTSAEELRQISEQLPGFSAIGAIAEGLGVTIAEAFKLVESGAVSGDEGIRLILEGMEDFPGAAGAMERQSKTLNGVISTFKDTLATTAIDFITPYLPAISSAVASFGGFLEDMAARLKTLIESEGFRDFKETVGGIITDGLQAILDFWNRNGESILQWFSDFGETAGAVLSTIGDFIWQTVLPALEQFGSWFFEDGPGVQIAIAGLATALALYTVNALAAAAATLLAIAPYAAFAVIVGALTWATHALIDQFDLLPKASRVFQWVIDHAIVPLIRALERAIDLAHELKEALSLPGLKGLGTGGNSGSSSLDFLQGRASGGPVAAGVPYVVGENRPELFVPDTNGTILPSVPAGAGGFRDLTIIGELGEDPVERAFREARRASMLAGT